MDVILIQSPLVQLNSPYPSGAYLTAFFKSQKQNAHWYDLSLELFYSIFSRNGLTKLFSLSKEKALKLAFEADNQGDENTAFNLRRYVSTSQNWIDWIDWIVANLCGGAGNQQLSGREKAHQFLFSPFSPRGSRMENYLGGLDHSPTIDDVRFLCSLALADLADYITVAFDSDFSLIRYAEALTVDETSFSQIAKNIDSPVLKNFLQPVLEEKFGDWKISEKTIIGISVPFAGTFVPALFIADFFKKKFGNLVFTCIGGGFVNTELRDANDSILGNFLDGISFDRGYGSYLELLKDLDGQNPIYKMRRFVGGKVIEPLWKSPEAEAEEARITSEIIPDYSDIDFSRYPRVCDDKNPMQRMWSDGAWIKAYMAHGCYWHKCAFCDTQLDYVCGYKPVALEPLYNGLLKTAVEKGVYGIHFVDEALPPAMLKTFALQNAKEGAPLFYWGNVRFEKTFTRELAQFLSFGGLGGVSAGLEVATGEGLSSINKGTDVESIVSACAAFKEAGILVHAYMIYGFWMDTPQSIINSMETLRQFFAAGLLDCAFWHKFVLTKNSQVYSEYLKGEHPELKPIIPKNAKNNLHFAGEEKFNKFGLPLDSALSAWMHGEKIDMKVQRWFDFPVPAPTVPKDYVDKLIEKYEQKSAARKNQNVMDKGGEGLYWLGSMPVVCGNGNGASEISWIFLMEEQVVASKNAEAIAEILWNLRPAAVDQRAHTLDEIKKAPQLQKELQKFRNIGLVCI